MAAYARTTLRTLKDRLSERVGNNVTFWGDDEKRDAINEALLIWQAMTGEFSRVFSIPIQSSLTFYNVPKQIVSLIRMSFSSTNLVPTSLWELDMGTPGWPGTVGNPTQWAPVGLNMFALFPKPTSGSLLMEGYMEVPKLTGDGDFVQMGDEEINAILDYAHHYTVLKEGGKEFKDSQKLFQNFVTAAGVRNKRFKATDLYAALTGMHRDEEERPARSRTATPGIRE